MESDAGAIHGEDREGDVSEGVDRPSGARDYRVVELGGLPTVVRFSAAADVGWLAGLEAVDRVERRGDQVQVTGSGPVVALVAAALVERGIVPADLRSDPRSLEATYLSLTGRSAAELDA